MTYLNLIIKRFSEKAILKMIDWSFEWTLGIYSLHVFDEINNTVGVAKLIVIPGN